MLGLYFLADIEEGKVFIQLRLELGDQQVNTRSAPAREKGLGGVDATSQNAVFLFSLDNSKAGRNAESKIPSSHHTPSIIPPIPPRAMPSL